MAYQSAEAENLELATSNLRRLSDAFLQFTEECFSILTPGLVMWISDQERLLTDGDYELVVGSTYEAILQFIRSLPTNGETLAEYSELLGCIAGRIASSIGILNAFHSFWTEVYADVVTFDNVPASLCPLLLAMEELVSSQITEEENQPPSISGVTVDLAGGVFFELPESGSSFELSPPPTPSSIAETLEEDPLSLVAPASEAPEENDSDSQSTNGLTRWKGSYEDLGQQMSTGGGAVQSPYYEVSKPHGHHVFSFHSPEGSIPGLGLSTSGASPYAPRHGQASVGTVPASPSEELLSPNSPNSKKKRPWDNDCEPDNQYTVRTPAKRRKQDKDDSDDDSDDDHTPIRPWFDADFNHEKADIPRLGTIPFQPFTQHNLPKGPYKFSAPTNSHSTITQSRPIDPVIAINPMFNQRSFSGVQYRLSSARHLVLNVITGNSHSFFVDSAPSERHNPSAKRRRLTEPPAVQTHVASQIAPNSDEVQPSSG